MQTSQRNVMATRKPLIVRVIPFANVQTVLDSSSPGQPQKVFNAQNHSLNEITAALPSTVHSSIDAAQPWELFSPWLYLICASQHIDRCCVHTIKLPSWYCELLTNAGRLWQMNGRLSDAIKEDLEEGFPQRTIAGEQVTTVFVKGSSFFVRLDTCSLKDAQELSKTREATGASPATRPEQVWQRIVTSIRG